MVVIYDVIYVIYGKYIPIGLLWSFKVALNDQRGESLEESYRKVNGKSPNHSSIYFPANETSIYLFGTFQLATFDNQRVIIGDS